MIGCFGSMRDSGLFSVRQFVSAYSRLATLVLLSSLFSSSHASSTDRWVHGSYVNVRESADPKSSVVEKLTANTKIVLVSEVGDACEIKFGESRTGYMPCRYIGDQPLSLVETASPFLLGGYQDNSQFSPPRAFWIAPSAAALTAAGKHFWKTLLSEKQRDLEWCSGQESQCYSDQGDQPAPKLARYKLPEYEAMKAVLAEGIIAPPNLNPPMLSCSKVLQSGVREKSPPDFSWIWHYPNRRNYPHGFAAFHDCEIPDIPALRLPNVGPSYFKTEKDLLRGSAGIEAVSAHFQITERGRVTAGPKWIKEPGNYHYSGAWDIGSLELMLDKSVTANVIASTGQVTAYEWWRKETWELAGMPTWPTEECVIGYSRPPGMKLLSGYPQAKDKLILFVTTKPLPSKKSKVIVKTENNPTADGAQTGRLGTVLTARAWEIDVDQDGVADFVRWEITRDRASDYMLSFVNINGEWFPFDSEKKEDCDGP